MSRLPLFELDINPENDLRPSNYGLHQRMLRLYKQYHTTAKLNSSFSLKKTLFYFQKIIQSSDPWLNQLVSDELLLLTQQAVDNPYWIGKISAE